MRRRLCYEHLSTERFVMKTMIRILRFTGKVMKCIGFFLLIAFIELLILGFTGYTGLFLTLWFIATQNFQLMYFVSDEWHELPKKILRNYWITTFLWCVFVGIMVGYIILELGWRQTALSTIGMMVAATASAWLLGPRLKRRWERKKELKELASEIEL